MIRRSAMYLTSRFVCRSLFLALLWPSSHGIAQTEAKLGTSLGPQGGRIISLAIDPSDNKTIYAGTMGGGILKTTNGGASWITFNTKVSVLESYEIPAIAIDTNTGTVYAGNSKSGVFKSVDGGGSWVTMNTGLTDTSVRSLAIDPFNKRIIYAGTYKALFKSVDGGASWTPASEGLSGPIVAIAIDSSRKGAIYAGVSNGVFKSVDGGASWSSVNPERNPDILYNVRDLIIDPSNSNIIYAGGMGISRSLDGGRSWSRITPGRSLPSVIRLAIEPKTGTLYAGTFGRGILQR